MVKQKTIINNLGLSQLLEFFHFQIMLSLESHGTCLNSQSYSNMVK